MNSILKVTIPKEIFQRRFSEYGPRSYSGYIKIPKVPFFIFVCSYSVATLTEVSVLSVE